MRKKYGLRRALALLAMSTMLLSSSLGDSIIGIKAEAAELSSDSVSTLPIVIDGNADDWELYKGMAGTPAGFEYVKAVKTADRLYVAFKTNGTPNAVPAWYLGINADGNEKTGYSDYAGADYAFLGDDVLHKNTNPNDWSWEAAEEGSYQVAISSDGSFAEYAIDLHVTGDNDALNITVLDGEWAYVFKNTPAVSDYAKTVNSIASWNKKAFSNEGTDGAYISAMTQEEGDGFVTVAFETKDYKKTRFWAVLDNVAELKDVGKVVARFESESETPFNSVSFELYDETKANVGTLSAVVKDGLITAVVPENSSIKAKYIRVKMDSIPANVSVKFYDIDFIGKASAASEGGEGEGETPAVNPSADSEFTLDGKDDDWRDISNVLSETNGAFDRIAACFDDNYLYIHFTVNSVSDWKTLHLFLDTDNNSSTGFPNAGGGYEYMLEGASIYMSEGGEWPNTKVGTADIAKSTDGSLYEVRVDRSVIDSEKKADAYKFMIGLVNADWATVYTFPGSGSLTAKNISEVRIESDEPYISDFAIHTDFIRALSKEALQGGEIASFTANGGDGKNYSYSFAYNSKYGKDNDKFSINGDKLIVKDKMLAPGLYNIYVRVGSGVRSEKKAFEIEVHASDAVAITEDYFNGHNGEWFTVPYKAANAVPNLTELRAVADSEKLSVELMAVSLSNNLRIYISDNKTAGADMSATWANAGSMAYMIDAEGNFYKYQGGSFVKTVDAIEFSVAANGLELSVPVSCFDGNADTFFVGADDGAGAVLPNEGEALLTCTAPLKGTPISITADGDPSDWTDEYKIGEGSGSLGDLWAVRTADYLYAMTYVTVPDAEKDTEYSYSTNLYIDSDNNTSTGYGYKEIYTKAGGDFLVQDWYTNNVEMSYRTGNGDGFGFSHSAGDCGNNLSDYKITKETGTPGVYCIEYKIPISKMENTLAMMVDDCAISVQRDSTVRTAYPGVTKAIGKAGTYYSLVPKFGTSFGGVIDGNLSEWASIPNVAVNTATENVYNMYTTKSQYKIYTMVTSDNNDLDTTTRFVISTSDNTGYTYFGYDNADYVVKDGVLYPVVADGKLGNKIKAVDITYNTDAVELRLYISDLNSDQVKIAALTNNKSVKIPEGKYVAVTSEFEMFYDTDYVYPYENFETYNNPYKGWAAWANAKLSEVEKIAYDHNLAFFPVTWEDVEAKKGTYDWTYVNNKYQLDYWKKNGTRINFRFVMDTPEVLTGSMKDTTYGYYVDKKFMEDYKLIGADGKVSEDSINKLFATGNFRADLPAWLVAELCNEALSGKTENAGTFYNWPGADVLGGASFSPNYYSDLLLNYHNDIIAAFAERFDDTSITGFVQVGSLGHWGEFHTWPEANSFSEYDFGSGDFPDPARAGEYAMAYVNNFKDIKIGLRYPYPVAAKNGFGLFNDVFGAQEGSESFIGAIKNGNTVNITNPGPTDSEDSKMPDFWKTNYSGGEFSNGNVKLWINNDAIMRSISYLEDSHTSWLGPCSPCDLIDGDFDTYEFEGNIKYLQRLMGYRFSVEKVNYTPSVDSGNTLSLSIDWRNLGVAPFYYNWPLEVSLVDSKGKVVASKVQDVNITSWLPDTDINTTIDFEIPSKIKKGRYKLAVAILDPDTNEPAMHLAMEGGDDNLRYGLYYINVGSQKLVDASFEDSALYGISGKMLLGAPVSCAEETTLPGGITGTVYGRVPMNSSSMLTESNTLFALDENQVAGQVNFVAGASGSMRLRAVFEGGAGVTVHSGDKLVIEFEADEAIGVAGIPVQACFDSASSYNSENFVTLNDLGGYAVMDVPADADGKTLYAIRIKGNNYPEGSRIAMKGIYFATESQTEGDETEGGTTEGGEKPSYTDVTLPGGLTGDVYSSVPMDSSNMSTESDTRFVLDENQVDGQVNFVAGASGNTRLRAVFAGNEGITVHTGDKLIIAFEADEAIKLAGVAVQACFDSASSYNSVDFVTMNDLGGYAVMDVPANADGKTLYAIRIKGNGYPEGSKLAIKGVYLAANVEEGSTDPTEPVTPAETPVGKSFEFGTVTGTIVGYAKMNSDNVTCESGSLKHAADQTDGTVKFTSDGSGNIRNRVFINEKAGVVLHKGDKMYVEFEADKDVDLTTIELQACYDNPDTWDSVGFLMMSDKGGYMFVDVPESADGQKLCAVRLKAGNAFTKGASVTFKKWYFVTDVKDSAAIEYNYEFSDIVGGVTVTYYNDIFSRGVSWRTKGVSSNDSVLQYVDATKVDNIGNVPWEDETVVTTISDNCNEVLTNTNTAADVYYCHKAHITNIPDGTVYYYRVGGETTGYSKPGIMTIDSSKTEFQFIHVTDPQATSLSEYQQYAELLKAAYDKAEEEGYALMGTFNTGDITNENHDGKIYIDQYNMSQDLDADDLMNSVFIPVAGNHDVTEDIFYKMYDIDFANYCTDGKHNTHRTGGCYSLQIGNVFVIGTNSNESGDLNGGCGEYDSKASYIEQYRWIEEQLKKASALRDEGKVDWIIYLTHAGMMSVGYHTMDGGSVKLRENITPLLAKYEADLVLQGHDHAYTRTVPYYYGLNGIGEQFSGYESNHRETFDGNGDITYDNPFTEAVETEAEGGRIWNIEPEGTHYVTINFAGTKSLDISKDNAESSYKMPDDCIMDGIAISPVNGIECGLKYAKQFYGIITVSGDTLTYDTYEFSGSKSTLFDTFTVIKDGNHEADLDKKDVDFTGVFSEDKEYDGKSIRIDYSDIVAVKGGTNEVESEFTDYDKISFYVTGTLANGKAYTVSNKLPTEVGNYTLHVVVGDNCAFFKGETEFAMTIKAATPKAKEDSDKYVGGLTKDIIGAGKEAKEDTPVTPSGDNGGSSEGGSSNTGSNNTNASENNTPNIIERGREVLGSIGGIIRNNTTGRNAAVAEAEVVENAEGTVSEEIVVAEEGTPLTDVPEGESEESVSSEEKESEELTVEDSATPLSNGEKTSTPLVAGIVAVAVLLLALAGYFVITKKKNAAEE